MPIPTPTTIVSKLRANNVKKPAADADPAAEAQPGAIQPAPPKLRRRPVAIAIGVLIVVLGSLSTAFVVASLQDTVQVVAVRANIERGSQIEATDLMSVSIRPDPALRTLPADQLSSLIGKRAAMDLHAGGLISPESVADKVVPAAGQSVVGIPLEPGQLPGWQLKAGDKVRIISTPRAQDDAPLKAPALSLEASVLDVHAGTDQLLTVVDVVVPTADAEKLGALAATRRIALVLDNG